eukprot:1158467-Pelagomonas_calceolata.AAC.8
MLQRTHCTCSRPHYTALPAQSSPAAHLPNVTGIKELADDGDAFCFKCPHSSGHACACETCSEINACIARRALPRRPSRASQDS